MVLARNISAALSLAAMPTFAFMALLSGGLEVRAPDLICPAHPAFLSGMVPMYLLMCAFHSAPWLRLLDKRRGAGPRAV
jgi:hypothetical protein